MKEKKKTLPYFARFLEGVDEEVMKSAKGGQLTHKYPSDWEEVRMVEINSDLNTTVQTDDENNDNGGS